MRSHEIVELDSVDIVIIGKIAKATRAIRQNQAYIVTTLGFVRIAILVVGGVLIVLATGMKPNGAKGSLGRLHAIGQRDELRHDNSVCHPDPFLLATVDDDPSDVEDDDAGPGNRMREEHRSLLVAMGAPQLGHGFDGADAAQEIPDMDLLVAFGKERTEIAVGVDVHRVRGTNGVSLTGTRVVETGLIRDLGRGKSAGEEIRMAPLESRSKE
jgi:hypothetical protein